MFFASDLEYSLDFLLDAASIFSSRGTVNSPQMTVLIALKKMMTSGRSEVETPVHSGKTVLQNFVHEEDPVVG